MKEAPTFAGRERAIWPFRLWGVRHVRYLFCLVRVNFWAQAWARYGIGLGVPNDSDMKVLDAIWKGER